MINIGNDWDEQLASEFAKPYFQQLERFLASERKKESVFPDEQMIYTALQLTSFKGTRAVILGQDPYHGRGQAHGLSFSVQRGIALPRSLANIFKELKEDAGVPTPSHGNLEAWARQGVLLLNTVLTVREGAPASHKGKGWELFTNRIIHALNQREAPVVFILWGMHAAEKRVLIDESKHRIIASAHPSPLSARRGFFGSRPFSRANELLRELGMQEIDWRIPDVP